MTERKAIQRRKRFFVGCEGESERGYAALLQKFADEADSAVHAYARVINRAGDQLALAQRAAKIAAQSERGSQPAFKARFLMLDTDKLGQNPGRDAKIPQVLDRHKFTLVKQVCCFEAFLLRHFKGHQDDQPPDAASAMSRLREIWPDYKKGSAAQELRKRLSLAEVQTAARNPCNSDFEIFLRWFGLLPE